MYCKQSAVRHGQGRKAKVAIRKQFGYRSTKLYVGEVTCRRVTAETFSFLKDIDVKT